MIWYILAYFWYLSSYSRGSSSVMNKSDNTSLPPDSINRHYARILVFCNPILDILASPPPELLHKYGLNPNDAILSNSETLPLYAHPDLDTVHSIEF